MLLDLLRKFDEGHVRSMAELADELRVSPPMLDMVLKDCERMGYLERVGGACDADACASCCGSDDARSVQCAGVTSRPQLAPSWWRITEKGTAAVRRASPRVESPGA